MAEEQGGSRRETKGRVERRRGKRNEKNKGENGREHGWKILHVVQIFVGAEKQSGIRSRARARYGTANARSERPGIGIGSE